MSGGYEQWTGAARTMAQAVDAAVAAARAGDAEAFSVAAGELARVDHEQLAVLLGAVTRDLLERLYPDGLDSDDAEQVLRSCTTAAAGWYPALDGAALAAALIGTLGISEPDEAPPRDGASVVAHGVLLIADLLTVLDQELLPPLDTALRELLRAQTIELP